MLRVGIHEKKLMQSFDISVTLWQPMFFKSTNTRPNEYKETIRKLLWEREKELSFETSIRSWHTPRQYSTENPWTIITCVSAICLIHAIAGFYQVNVHIFDEVQCLPTYCPVSFPCYILCILKWLRKVRSTLVISLRGIGGSKKSRLLLSSKRPT